MSDAQFEKVRKQRKINISQVLERKLQCPGITTRQLAAEQGVTQGAISNLFQKLNISHKHIEEFKGNRADILAGIQSTVLATLVEDDIKKASIRDRAILFGTLYDKERLERGQSTQNVATILASAVVEATASRVKTEEETGKDCAKVVTIEAATQKNASDNG